MRKRLGIKGEGLPERFRADKAMIAQLDRELESHPGVIEQLDKEVSGYMKGLEALRLRDWVVEKGKQPFWRVAARALVQVVLFPLFVFGWVHNIIPYAFTASRVKGIKDQQFHSSVKWVVGMIAFPVMYIIVAVILAFVGWPWWTKVLYILFLPVAGISAFRYYINARKLGGTIRFSRLARQNDDRITKLLSSRKTILEQVNAILDKQEQSAAT